MFVEAIENAAKYTRPIHTISRNHGSKIVQPGAATLFIVNEDGWALTCKHVAIQIATADKVGKARESYKKELASLSGAKKKQKRDLLKKYGFSSKAPYDMLNRFVNCVEGRLGLEVRMHETLDIALIHFQGHTELLCDTFPSFASEPGDLKQGMFLCRLGFPFAEFSNFEYDDASDAIRWTTTGRADTPRFPIEGMVTRHVSDMSGQVVGFELSTPGLRGQSGCPVFGADGIVWGMQSATAHMDLNFDIDQHVLRSGQETHVRDHAFLHVGRCMHVACLKEFMDANGVEYNQA